MRTIARKQPGPGLAEGGVVDGYVVESLVADRGHAELICDAVGPDAEAVTLVVAWRAPVDRHALPRFRRLARRRAALEHEALVPVRAVGAYSGRPYLAMDRYPETTFEALIARAPLPAHQVLALLAPACDALDLAHANGLVHQSLSDTSLLMEGDSLLLDGFGLAGGPRELSFESVGVHEVRYCPPEELRGEPLEGASNVYSLTALLVHAITGSTPYRGAPAAHAYGHLVEPPPRPSAQMPQLGSAFDEVVARGMAKDPAERPGSAGELVGEAAAALGVDLPQRHVSGEGQERGRRHRPAAVRIRRVPRAAVAATVTVAAAAGIAGGLVLDPFDGSRASAAGASGDARLVERLDDQRTPLRARLATGETPQEQATTAAELADLYGRAADVAESARVASAARAGERAYEELAAAAEAGSDERFAAASEAVTRADANLQDGRK
jgi:serine/threonine-protein kinase